MEESIEAQKDIVLIDLQEMQRSIETRGHSDAVSVEMVRAAKGDDDMVFIMSEEVRDSHGTIIKLDQGADLSRYEKNPVLIWMHKTRASMFDGDYNEDNVLGYTKTYFEDGKLKCKPFFESVETTGNLRAEKVKKKIKFGSLSALSIGIRVYAGSMGVEEKGEDKNTYYIREWELRENSIVVLGSNANAVVEKRGTVTPEETDGPTIKDNKDETRSSDENPPYRNSLKRAKRKLVINKFLN